MTNLEKTYKLIARGYRKAPRKSGTQLRILRMRNQLEQIRLRNILVRYKLAAKVGQLKRTAIIIPPRFAMPQKILKPRSQVFQDPRVLGDIHSAFNADIINNESLFGTESWFGDEDWFGGEKYYTENWFGDENIFEGMTFEPRRGLSPLLY